MLLNMSKVKCDLFDKAKNPTSSCEVVFKKVDYIHALLLLNEPLKFTKRAKLFLSYLYKLSCDLSFSHESITISRDFSKTYDGTKREMSEIYGAANTIIVALKQLGQKSIFPFDEFVSGMRPDFISKDSKGNYSLFESKGSINRVKTSDVDKSIKQINSRLLSKKPYSFIRGYSVISDFNLNISKSLSLRIYDPKSDGEKNKSFDFVKRLKQYHSCICNILNDNEDDIVHLSVNEKDFFGIHIAINEKEELVLGIEEDIYSDYSSCDACYIDETYIHSNVVYINDVPEEELFDDGLYLKIIKNNSINEG